MKVQIIKIIVLNSLKKNIAIYKKILNFSKKVKLEKIKNSKVKKSKIQNLQMKN